MNSIVKTAKTVNEAIEAALKELNATRDMVDVEVQEESKSGFLGFLGSRNAVVKVTLKEVVEENKDFNAPCDFKSEYVEKDEPEALEFAKKYLLDMLKQLDITANIEIKKDFENEKVDFVIKDVLEERVGAVIGKRGESIDAFQYLVNIVTNKNFKNDFKIYLDIGNYREKREEIIKSVAIKAAKKVKIFGRTIKLHPMNPYERRIVHFTLQNFDGVETYSEGREPFRRVVIDVKK